MYRECTIILLYNLTSSIVRCVFCFRNQLFSDKTPVHAYSFTDPHIPGRNLYKSIMSDHIQTRSLLPSCPRSTSAVTVSEQIGHGHVDLGWPRSVRMT